MKVKDIDLCGLGNSLVDIQIKVEDDIIKQLGLTKGEMVLVDEERQKEIISLLDDKNRNLCSGGSAANTIIAFAKFGGKAAYLSLLGNDELGKFYADEFTQFEIELKSSYLETDKTGTCLVLITPDGERTMCTSLGATGKFSVKNLNEEIISRSKWLYIEGYKLTAEESTEAVFRAIEIAKSHDVKIATTFSDGFITKLFRVNLEKVVSMSDLIFCNENEALSYTGKDSINSAFEMLSSIVPNIVITLGEKGSIIKWGSSTNKIPAYATVPVDSTGAGDIFAGGFLYGVIVREDPLLAGHLGSYAASRIVSVLGARLEDNYLDLLRFVEDKIN